MEEIQNIPQYIENNPNLLKKFKKEETFTGVCTRTTAEGKKEVFVGEPFSGFGQNNKKKKTKNKVEFESNLEDEIIHEVDEIESYEESKRCQFKAMYLSYEINKNRRE